MKYGLLVWKMTDNIGDDIQSYAAKRFLPKIDYYIDRESLDTFLPFDKEEVAMIMNGWYLHHKENFPPSEYIIPHLTSMYFSTGDNWTIEKSVYLTKYGKEYLEKFGPIGVRDFATGERLSQLGIKNYFSGCMTLTLPKFNNVKKGDYICSVDLGEEKNEKLRTYYKDKNQEIIYTAQALDPDKNSRLTYEQRFENIEKLLKLYQGAKAIITTRLHCALPCLALGLPVILIYNESSFDRLASFKNLMTMMSNEEFMKFDGELNYANHQEEIDKIRKPLIESCEKFIEFTKNKPENKELLEIEEYKRVKRLDYIEWIKDIMKVEIADRDKDLKYFREYQKQADKELLECRKEIDILTGKIQKNKRTFKSNVKHVAKKILNYKK
ncbi:MAG: polysaccharide pyruvyl transferase family protein [Clostridia bacterium]|nr:polysaccharide pyruvyl transferase family protein [Clostridia bacterium]